MATYRIKQHRNGMTRDVFYTLERRVLWFWWTTCRERIGSFPVWGRIIRHSMMDIQHERRNRQARGAWRTKVVRSI